MTCSLHTCHTHITPFSLSIISIGILKASTQSDVLFYIVFLLFFSCHFQLVWTSFKPYREHYRIHILYIIHTCIIYVQTHTHTVPEKYVYRVSLYWIARVQDSAFINRVNDDNHDDVKKKKKLKILRCVARLRHTVLYSVVVDFFILAPFFIWFIFR